jgi:hypothetical protein
MTHTITITTLWRVLVVLAFIYAVHKTVRLPNLARLLVDLVLLTIAFAVKRVRRRILRTRLQFELAIIISNLILTQMFLS